MSPLVVAQVLSSFGVGGQERLALDLAGGLVRRGHRVLAISLAPADDGSLAVAFAARGAEVSIVEKRVGLDPTLTLRLAHAFRRAHVDVVHTHNPQPLIYAAPAARLVGATLVHTKHGRNPAGPGARALRRVAGHLAHAYVAVSSATADVARATGECTPGRLVVLENGIDLRAFHADPIARDEVRRELGIPLGAWVFGTVGRLSPEKDHLRLLEAARPLLDAETWLLVAGDGECMPALRTAAAGLSSIVFAGMRADVPRVLSALDAFVLSSRTEGMPLALIEAMATALPIVATDVGGVRGVTGDAAILVPPEDTPALSSAMRTLHRDRARALALGRRMLERAREHDIERVIDAYVTLYRAAPLQRVRTPVAVAR